VGARSTVETMTDWPAEWRPVNPEEARKYLDAHQDGSGDPELIEECEFFLSLDRQPPSRPSGESTGDAEELNLPEPPEDLSEEKGAD
jgi:hypothetical protein